MKKYSLLLSVLALTTLTVFNGCTSQEQSTNEASFDIISPTQDQMFHPGEAVPIKATLTGKEPLHGWSVEIRKKADGTVLFAKSLHTHGPTLGIDESWTNDLADHTDLVLEVFAQLDHDGTLASKTVDFHAHP